MPVESNYLAEESRIGPTAVEDRSADFQFPQDENPQLAREGWACARGEHPRLGPLQSLCA